MRKWFCWRNIWIGGVSAIIGLFLSIKSIIEGWGIIITIGLLFVTAGFVYLFYQGLDVESKVSNSKARPLNI
ncbi:MAG: hypothetical protein AABX03_03575 [Nanoarchaeota archaeon]